MRSTNKATSRRDTQRRPAGQPLRLLRPSRNRGKMPMSTRFYCAKLLGYDNKKGTVFKTSLLVGTLRDPYLAHDVGRVTCRAPSDCHVERHAFGCSSMGATSQ